MWFQMRALDTLWRRIGQGRGPGDVIEPPEAGKNTAHPPPHSPHSTRISDIRLFIVDARPAMAATSFVLMTTFPNKELADESQTLKEANLLNAVIVQRLT